MNGIGETGLHFLAVENDGAAVAWLHARGSDLNTRDPFDSPGKNWAAEGRRPLPA